MIELPRTVDEQRRLAMLATLSLTDRPQDDCFVRLAELVQDLVQAPVALVSLVDAETVWFIGAAGYPEASVCRWDSFCSHAINRPSEVLWVADALEDVRFRSNPFVTGAPFVRFYAGVPIQVNRCVVGALCVLDVAPRAYDPALEARLRRAAAMAEAELAVRHKLDAIQTALEASADALVDHDVDGNILSWSNGAASLFGYSAQEVVGANVRMLVPPEGQALHDRNVAHWRELGPAGANHRLEVEARRKDGSRVDIELWLSISHLDGVPQIHANVRDITTRKAQAHELLIAKAQAEAANRSKSAFLANMSHELRTPLNGVIGVAGLLSSTTLSAAQKELVDIVQSSSDHLAHLIGDILDIARIEAGELRLNVGEVGLTTLVRSVVAPCEIKAAEKGIALTWAVSDDADVEVLADGVRLKQVMTNLVSNAVKFTETGGVTVALTRSATRYRFEVADTGVGFDDGVKRQLFDRFQQADETITRRFGGTGLGLAISKDLVAAMGGSLDCASEPGLGSRFWFEIDLATRPAGGIAHEPAQDCAALPAARVLVVDDNETNRRVAGLILDSLGIDSVAAADGAEALDLLAGQPFDLVLMDMMMPVMDGLTATRLLRARERRSEAPRTPVIMLTANTLPEHVEECLGAGADLHLPKPVTPASILSALSSLLAAEDEPATQAVA
jgi:PAS domain S-box-containing protein